MAGEALVRFTYTNMATRVMVRYTYTDMATRFPAMVSHIAEGKPGSAGLTGDELPDDSTLQHELRSVHLPAFIQNSAVWPALSGSRTMRLYHQG